MPRIVSCGKSDVGLKRSNNEDALVLEPELGFVSVADGMGGEASGEVASQVFADTIVSVFSSVKRQSERETVELVQRAFQLANERILGLAREDSRHRGMGCTAELIAFYGPHFVLGHVGDSRTYLYRKGKLTQMTRDHSLLQSHIEQGLIGAGETEQHSLRNVILRAVGVEEVLEVDIIRGGVHPGDLFLLSSDGLTDMVDDTAIGEVLSLSSDLPDKVDTLIRMAKSAGGDDNITVIVCEVQV